MNYTESLDNVVHTATAQPMHSDTAAIPTTFSAKDANMLVWSLMEVVKRSGLPGKSFNPDDATSYRVFLNALERLYPQKQLLATSGTGAAYVVTPDVMPDAYTAGLFFRVHFHANSLANPTLKVGAGDLPAVAFKQYDSTGAKINAVMVADLISDVMFDGTHFVLLDPLPSPSSLPSGTPLMWPTLDCPSWAVQRDGSALTRTVYPALYAILAPLRVCTITTNAAGAVITGLARTSDLWAGMPAEHANLAAGTTIKSIDGTSQVTLSNNATGTLAGTTIRFFLHGYGTGGGILTFGLPDDRGLFERGLDTGSRTYEKSIISGTTMLNSNVITGVSSTRGLFIGQPISAPSTISAGVTITALTANTITMSAVSPLAGVATITVVGGQVGNERADDFKSHNHTLNGMGSGGTFLSGADYPLYYNSTNGATNSTGGAETRPRFRDYLAIMVI